MRADRKKFLNQIAKNLKVCCDKTVKETLDSLPKEESEYIKNKLKESQDFYFDKITGYKVFTERFLKKRGYCCGSGCRHCPY